MDQVHPTSNRNQDSSRTKSGNPATGLALAIVGGDSTFLKEKRPSLKFVPPVILPGSRPTPSVSMPTRSETKEKDEFDDEFDDSDNWWSGIGDVTVVVGGAKDDGKLVTGKPRSTVIGEKSPYYTEQ